MDVVESLEALRAWRAAVPGPLGFVPTMGALHDGHLSLVRRARRECERVVVSIFVNPAQFGPHEDFERYPRDLARDLVLLDGEGVHLVFAPTPAIVYPAGFSTWVTVETLTERWEGAARPGHFRGVATVVLKLLNLVQPDRAYFGEKDYQQLRVIERMARDLNVSTTIVPCPTVREPDGLAMSSRNAYLAAAQRQAATVIFRALVAARQACERGERDPKTLAAVVEGMLAAEPLVRIDYVAVVDPGSLEPLTAIAQGGAVCCVAAWVGAIRLIDNLVLAPPADAQGRR
ncbi:MAG TPA: pantoate--beta-alanine ligase [Methylomirabilota bacterium]|jgi:pantoate--beta-alanine ligase|nr:pantoate--beta-alanine ligase [Methylomirabilota bacterium]